MTEKLPKVRLLTCGGTIVSSGESASQMTGYRLKDFSVDALLAAVPGLADVARIDVREVARIDSMSMTASSSRTAPTRWRKPPGSRTSR